MKKVNRIIIPDEMINFYQELEQTKQKFMKNLPQVELDETQKKYYLEQKAPLLNFVGFKIDEKEAQQVFEDLVKVVLKYRPAAEEQLARIQKTITESNQGLAYLTEKLVWQGEKLVDDLAKEHSLDEDLLSLLLVNTAKPFAASAARSLFGQVSGENEHQNVCPVCGWAPSISVTEAGDERKRVLHCSLCDSSWHFKTIECPHCLNEDHETLKYLSLEGDEGHGLNVCEKCHGYIKTVDQGKLSAIESAALMDIRSIYLDLLASENGYLKK